jgi:hypothetical protein
LSHSGAIAIVFERKLLLLLRNGISSNGTNELAKSPKVNTDVHTTFQTVKI